MKEIMITSSVLILCIMLIRVIFRGKISSRLQYALWILVALRLMIPASVQIYMALGSIEEFRIMDLANLMESKVEDVTVQLEKPVHFTMSLNSDLAGQAAEFMLGEELDLSDTEDGLTSVFLAGTVGGLIWLDVLRGIWIGGMVIVALWMFFMNVIFTRKLHKGRREFVLPESEWPEKINLPQDEKISALKDMKISGALSKTKIYIIEGIASPCLYGVPFREAVYLTPDITENQDRLRHVLTHEMCHKRHGDSFWSILRSILLIIYWMNPLVWVAAVFSKRDCELACDEEALLILGEEERIHYGETLLSIITSKGKLPDIACTATTMTGSGKSVKERIKYIADKPRVLGVTVVAVLILVIAVTVLVFTKNPLFHGTTWEGETTLVAGDMQIKLPETIAGISGYETDSNGNIIIYQTASGEEAGRFCGVSYGEAVLLVEQGREVVPIGNYGRNPYLLEYMNSFYPNRTVNHYYTPFEGIGDTRHTYTPGNSTFGDSVDDGGEMEYYVPADGSEPEGVPGTDSNEDASAYIIEDGYDGQTVPASESGYNWMSDSDWEAIQLEDEELQNHVPDETTDAVKSAYYPPMETVEESLTYLPNEHIIVTDTPGNTETKCYIYVKGDYSGVKDQYLDEMDYINNELQAVTSQIIILSINQKIREEMLGTLAANKTEYLGEAYRVGALINALPQPDGLQYAGISLQTDAAADLSLDVNYQLMTDSFVDVDGGDMMLFNAVMLFATIKNLDTCNFVVNPVEDTGQEIVTYHRADLEEIFGSLWSDEAADSQADYISWLENLDARVTEYLNGELN